MAEDRLAGQQLPCPACGTSLFIHRPAAVLTQPAAGVTVNCLCGRSYQPGPELAGRTVRCKACGNVLQVAGNAATYEPQAAVSAPAVPRPTRPVLPSSYKRPGVTDPRQQRIVIAVVASIGILALLGCGFYFVLLPMARQIAEVDEETVAYDAPSGDELPVSDEPLPDESDPPPADPEPRRATVEPVSPSRPTPPSSPSTFGSSSSDPFSDSESSTIDEPSAAAESQRAAMLPGTTLSATESLPGETTGTAPVQSKPGGFAGGVQTWYGQSSGELKGVRRAGDGEMIFSHYSWLTSVLPHLGHQKLYDDFNFSASWMDDENLQLSGVIVPEFLNPADQRQRWKGYPFDKMALSHFVGVSGVEDRRNVVAAKLPRDDPRAGIFGYDDVARRKDITDGESNTMMIIGSGKLASPWIAGGGATVRGAREPYFDATTGFGTQGGKGEGSITVMADGSVRFLSADVDPAVFRAMVTTHGAETVDTSPWLSEATLSK